MFSRFNIPNVPGIGPGLCVSSSSTAVYSRPISTHPMHWLRPSPCRSMRHGLSRRAT